MAEKRGTELELFHETIKKMRWEDTAHEFCPPSRSPRSVQFIAMELIEWLRRMHIQKSVRPHRADVSKPFGRELISFIGQNEHLTRILKVNEESIELSSRLSESDRDELIRTVWQEYPPDEPLAS